MDPLSITASVIAITTAIVQISQSIDSIRQGPKTLKDVKDDLAVLKPVLEELKNRVQNDPSQPIPGEQILAPAINNCEKVCKTFQVRVERWTVHSTEDKMFWYDKWKVGFSGVSHIKTFRAQLNECKSTLTLAISTAQAISLARQTDLPQSARDTILQDHESDIQEAFLQAQSDAQQLTLTQVSLESTHNQLANTPLQSSEESREELIQELNNQRSALEYLIQMCEEARAQTEHERTGVDIRKLRAEDHGKNLAGIFNMPEGGHKYDVKIEDLEAKSFGVNFAGVANGVNFADLMQTGQVDGTSGQGS